MKKPITEFPTQLTKTKKRYRLLWCTPCERTRTRTWHQNGDEAQKERRRHQVRKRYHKDPLRFLIYANRARMKIKQEVMAYYGRGKAACLVCGFDNIDALCLDHINDNGKEDRKLLGGSGGSAIYRKIKSKGLPPGYQTLCANHNMIKEIERKRKLRGY